MRKVFVIAWVLLFVTAVFSSTGSAQSEQQALKILKQAGDLQSKARSPEDLQRAVMKYHEALAMFDRLRGGDKWKAVTLGSLGSVYFGMGQHAQALDCTEKSLAIWLRLNDARGTVIALDSMAGVYDAWGKKEKAIECYERCLVIIRNMKDSQAAKAEGATLSALGVLYRGIGQHEKAFDNFNRALQVQRKAGDRKGEANTLAGMGAAHAQLSRPQQALECYEKSLQIVARSGDAAAQSVILNQMIKLYRVLGYYEKAFECNERFLKLAGKKRDERAQAAILNDMADLHKQSERMEKALQCLEKALAINRKLEDENGEMGTLNNMAAVYSAQGLHAKAIERLDESLEISRRQSNPRIKATVLGNFGVAYHQSGQYSKAVQYYEKSLEIDRTLKEEGAEAATLSQMGLAYHDWGQYEKALDCYRKAGEISARLKDLKGVGASWNNIGDLLSRFGQYSKALECFNKALEIAQKERDLEGEAAALNNIGLVYYAWGKYQDARERHEKSLEIKRKLGHEKGEALGLNNLAGLYEAWGQSEKALECYEQALEISRKLEDVQGQVVALNNMGYAYSQLIEYDKALKKHREALEICKKANLPTRDAARLIGNVYMDMGSLVEAEPLIKVSEHISSLGRLCLLKGDHNAARRYYEQTLASAEKSKDVNKLFAAFTGLGKICEAQGALDQAARYYKQAKDLTEEMRKALKQAERETFFSVRIEGFYRAEPYEGLARVLFKLNRPLEAYKESEHTKARVFAEAMSKRVEGADVPIPRDILEEDSRLNDELAELTKSLQEARKKGSADAIQTFEPQVRKKEAELEDHKARLRKDYPLFAASKYPDPRELSQTVLQDSDWCLAYDVTDSGVLIYLSRGKTLAKALFQSIPRKDLEDLIRKFREPLEIPSEKELTAKLKTFDLTSGKKLADLLLGAVLSDLPNDVPLIIVPDDCLGMLPFEMLALNSGGEIKTDKKRPYVLGAEFFGDRNPISYYQSVTALTLAREHGKRKASQDKLLVMADPIFEKRDARIGRAKPGATMAKAEAKLYEELMRAVEEGQTSVKFERLKHTGDLAKDLNEMFSGACTLYTGLDASKDAFVKKIAPAIGQYGKVVFATHGYFGKGLPGIKEPVLVLTLMPPGTDGFLRMSEVMGLKMNADIVALTACQTGRGEQLSGEGVMSLGRAFQYAGAKSVLMSLWSVAEEASVQLVESFFKNLKDGKNKLEALRLAREEIRNQGYDHPFYWAGFILVGEGN